MKKTILILGFILGAIFNVDAQITGVKYLIEYNDTTEVYDCKVVIVEGEATTYPQRIQFNSQYTIVVPTGTILTIDSLYNPKENNQFYTGTVPCLWEFGPKEFAPPTSPELDFHTVFPNLSPPSAYNDLYEGDTIILFSVSADIDPCDNAIRVFENGVDPSSQQMPSGGDFSCGHTFGGGTQTYMGQLTSEYGNNYIAENDSLLMCIGGCITLEPKISCYGDDLQYEWSTGDTTETIEVCPTEPSDYNLKIFEGGNLLDVIPVFVDFDPLYVGPQNVTKCAGSSLILSSCSASATWAQSSSNAFGVSLSPLAGGVTEVTISSFVSGTYDIICSIPGFSDTIQLTIIPLPLINISDAQICVGGTTIAASNIPGGEWVTNNPSIAIIDPQTGEISGLNEGSVTFTYTTSDGCAGETNSLTVNYDIDALFTGPDTICIGNTTTVSPTAGGTWLSANSTVATISTGGIVTGVSSGVTTLEFVDVTNGCRSLPLEITVEAESVEIIGPNGICVGESTMVSSGTAGTWTTSDPSVATVDPNTGVITGIASGCATFTFYDPVTSCYSMPSEMVCVSYISYIEIEDLEICVGETTQLTSDSEGTWVSDDPSVATVHYSTGLVTGVSSGKASFSLTNEFGCSENSYPLQLTVLPKTEVEIIGPSVICSGSVTSLSPSSGGSWMSTEPGVTVIDNSGNVTGVISGTSILTFTDWETGCTSDPLQITVIDTLFVPTVLNNGPLCQGEDLSLATVYLEGASYEWTGPDGFTSTEQNPIISNADISDQGSYCLKVSIDGCESAVACTGVLINYTLPAPNISSNSPICNGEDVELNAEFIAGATYEWTGPNGFISTDQNPVIVNSNVGFSGAYCLVVAVDGCESEKSCVDVVISFPSEVPEASSNSPLCDGETLELMATTVSGLSYSWTGPNGFSSSEQNPVLTNASPSDQGTYCVEAYLDGCISEMRCTEVIINPIHFAPEATSNGPICEGEDLELYTPEVINATYAWIGPNGFSSTLQNPTIAGATTIDAGQYCIVTTVNGCESNEGCIYVPVKSTPNTPSIYSNSPICEGEYLELATDFVEGATYSWADPNGFSLSGQLPLFPYDFIPVAGTYTLTITVDGCESEVAKAEVIINPQPVTPIASNNGPFCEGGNLELFTPPVTAASYAWTGPNGFTSAEQSPIVIGVTPAESGAYCVIVTIDGCVSSEGCTDVLVLPTPETPIVNYDGLICEGQDLSLTTSSHSGATYTWSGPDGYTSSEQNPIITGATSANNGDYCLVVTIDGCVSEASCTEVKIEKCLEPIPSCDEIGPDDIICDYNDLIGLSGILSDQISGGNQPAGYLCDSDDGPQNVSWFGFVALEGDYEIIINSNDCANYNGGSRGLKIGVYSSCDFAEENVIFCETTFNSGIQTRIASSYFIPGQTYFLSIDGYEGSICDYAIDVEGFYDNTYCTDLSKVTGVAYIDDNENGLYEVGETLLRNALISLAPGNFSVLTNEEGKYIINTPKGGATLTAKMNEGHWINDELTIEDLTIFETCVEGINFGFIPNLFYQEASISVANTVTRCDWETQFYFTVENTGTIDLDAKFEFEFDSEASYFASNLIGIQVNGEVASGNLGVLKPFEVKKYWIKLKMPSGSSVLPILDFKTTLYNSGDIEMDIYEQSEQLRCSYDPNDKREFPNREGEENLTLMDEDIEYTIRFQNNGNDTAFQVKIVDPLDPNIEPTSIRVINSSHAVETCIENENLIFLFENINLVDSMTNYDGSQGFVSFRCDTKDGRAENTIVNNTADIIFDTNEPIITNTTINTLVSELCTNVTSEINVDICEGEDYNGYEETGIYTEIYPLQYGCDSMIVINLEVQGITYSSQDVQICEGEAFELNGDEYILYESQELKDTMINQQGCISNIFIFDVTVNPVLQINIDTTICEGLEYDGLTESGIYTIESFDVITGCDIITTIDLEVLPMSDPSCLVNTNEVNANDVKIYPNPARDRFFIESNTSIELVTIYSIAYQKIDEFSMVNESSKVEISVEDLNRGLYIIAIKSGDGILYKKVLLE